MRFKKTLVVYPLVLLLLFAGMHVFSSFELAQSTLATLSGTIVDASDAAIPEVKVTLINNGTSASREIKTNQEGYFTAPLLPPGSYRVRAERAGFDGVEIPDLVLNVGDNKSIKIKMIVGKTETKITVTDEVPLVSTSASVGTVINRQFVDNLPLNGRSFQSLILLTPGVTVTATSSSSYGQFSVNGQRASTNYFTVDGVSANVGISNTSQGGTNGALAGSYPGFSAFGGTNNLVSVDALQEFKIQTSTYAAELGRQPGGQVSLVTRSGTNQFHGTLFEYFRNDALDAADWFSNANRLKKPALRQNQFGGTFSGPIFKDKTFFFFSYEGQRLRLPRSGIYYVPSLRVRSEAAAAIKPLLNAFPLPTGAELLAYYYAPNSGWAPSAYAISNPGTMDAYSIRIDHIVSSKLTLFGRFNQSPSDNTTFTGGAFGAVGNASTQTLTLGATAMLTPRLGNEFRINHSRQLGELQYVQATYGGAVPIDPALLTNGISSLGIAYFSYSGYSGAVYVGSLAENYQRQINVVDNVSLMKGTHQFKFGVDYRRLSPTYNVSSLEDVVFSGYMDQNAVTSGKAAYVSITNFAASRPRFDNYSVYGQDTWMVTPRLRLDYGLRWELNPVPSVINGQLPPVVNGITSTDSTVDVTKATLAPAGAPFYKTYYRAFAPRGGAAYQLNSTSGRETVLRGGFGIYYDLGSAAATSGFPLSASKYLFGPNYSGEPFPIPAADAALPPVTVQTSLPMSTTVYSNAQDLRLPYTLQWNVSVQQSLGTQQSLSVSYVGSAARRLLTTQNLNNPVNGVKPNSNFASIVYTWSGATSDYDSLQVQYQARLKRGMQALVNYTWSHAIDAISSDLGSNVLSRGNADFDVRHNFSAAVNYNLPTPNGPSVLKQVFSHWMVDGIVHAQSGLPVDVATMSAVFVAGNYLYVRPDYVLGQPLYIYDSSVPGGRRFNAAAFSTPTTPYAQGNFGRNVFRGLPIWQIDMALGRSFNFSERWKLQFKGELFNVFNHPMFGGYGTDYIIPSTFGVPTTMLSRSLGGLNYLYQMGGPRSVQFSLKLSF